MDNHTSEDGESEIKHRFETSNNNNNNNNNTHENDNSKYDENQSVTTITNNHQLMSDNNKGAHIEQISDVKHADKIISDKEVWTDLAENTRLSIMEFIDENLKTNINDLLRTISYHKNHVDVSKWNCNHKNDKSSKILEKNKAPPMKIFCHRDSVLTSLFQISHFSTVFNLCTAILIILLFNTLIQDLLDANSSVYVFDVNIFKFTFGKLDSVFQIWCLMQLATMLIPYNGFLIWQSHYNKCGKLDNLNLFGLLSYIAYQICFMVLPPMAVLKYDLPPASTVIVIVEQVRLIMKSHAFIRTTVGYELNLFNEYDFLNMKNGDSENSDTTTTSNTTAATTKTTTTTSNNTTETSNQKTKTFNKNSVRFSHYVYFLFAPTLVYRSSYPRTSKIRWGYVLKNLFETLCCVLFCYYIFVRFCFSQFQTFGQTSEYTLKQFILAFSACSFPGGFVMLTVFYGFLHAWLNAFAEMLKFGDRLFYKDFWNATSFSTWYRTWNVVVHDWLYTYIYRDIQLCVSKKSRALVAIIVFWISAIVHEYIIIMSLRIFFPIMFVNFAMAGLVLFFVQSSGHSWNVIIWLMLFIGNGEMMCLYSMEWYARKHCAPILDSWVNFLAPHLLLCQPVNGTSV